MLPVQNRLKKQADFSRTLDSGSKFRTAHLLFFSQFSDQDCPRLGVIISKKVSKKAVVRNRIRRQLLHLARPIFLNWGGKTKGDTVVLVTRLPEESANLGSELEAFKQWIQKK